MEDGLREFSSAQLSANNQNVLILVLMEDGLRGIVTSTVTRNLTSLNPCFNGRWSASNLLIIDKESGSIVLILVLMEDGLRAGKLLGLIHDIGKSLNPCFNGRWSARRR